MRRVALDVAVIVVLIGLALIAIGTVWMTQTDAFLTALLIGGLVISRPHKSKDPDLWSGPSQWVVRQVGTR